MNIITRSLILLSGLCLVLIPLAFIAGGMAFAYPEIAAHTREILTSVVIIAGLIICVLAFGLLMAGYFIPGRDSAVRLADTSIFFALFALGWKNIPYWANGLFFVFRHGTSSAYDPKGLIPMLWLSEGWRLPLLILFLLMVVFLLFNLIRLIARGFNSKPYGKYNTISLIWSILCILSFAGVPSYFYWLMD